MRKRFLLLLTLLTVSELFAQRAGDQLFDESYVHEVRLEFDPGELL